MSKAPDPKVGRYTSHGNGETGGCDLRSTSLLRDATRNIGVSALVSGCEVREPAR
jgi:hypothetical protein